LTAGATTSIGAALDSYSFLPFFLSARPINLLYRFIYLFILFIIIVSNFRFSDGFFETSQ
jgi:hypothetical protein